MGWQTDALSIVDRAAETGLSVEPRFADRYRERRADRRFEEFAKFEDFEKFEGRNLPNETPVDDAPGHVVVVVVDALRADAVGDSPSGEEGNSSSDTMATMGAMDAPTPFLDSLDGGTAISPSTWTFPAVTSLLTGQYPHEHGAIRQTDDFENSVADMTGLPPTSDETGIARRFAGGRYDTYGGFGMLVPFLALRGRFRTHRLRADASADRVLSDHLDWLGDRRDRRTFSYLHLADLHEPVDPPADYWQAHDVDPSIPDVRTWRHESVVESTPAVERYREHRRRLYRAAVEYVDNRLGAYYRRLSDLLGDDLALVVVGDHGEGFWERAGHAADSFADPRPAYCVGHGGAPYEVVTRVPLRAAGLDVSATFGGDGSPVSETPVSLVDVAPTLADAAGLDLDAADRDTAGESLRGGVSEKRTLLVESARYGYEKKAAYARRYKIFVSRGDGHEEIVSVPDEEPVEIPPEIESDLRASLPAFPDDQITGGERGRRASDDRVSRDVERRLAELGYR